MIRRFPSSWCLPFVAIFTLACDGGGSDAKQSSKSGASDKATPREAKDAEGKGAGKDPHAGLPPHAAGGPMAGGPMAGGQSMPKGPPRDIKPSGELVPGVLPGLGFSVPKEWETQTPASSMRLAQWVIPGPGGDGELVVFRFPGGGGAVQANVDRWKGQFKAPEGKTIDDVSKVETIADEGLSTTLVDVTGTYVAAVTPGADQAYDEKDYRMLAAIVEGTGDPFYFKLVAPKPTADLWADSVRALIASMKMERAAPAEGKAVPDAKVDAKVDAKTETKADEKKADAKADEKADAKGG